MTIALILMLLALAAFVADVVFGPTPNISLARRVNLVSLGLALMATSFAIQMA